MSGWVDQQINGWVRIDSADSGVTPVDAQCTSIRLSGTVSFLATLVIACHATNRLCYESLVIVEIFDTAIKDYVANFNHTSNTIGWSSKTTGIQNMMNRCNDIFIRTLVA